MDFIAFMYKKIVEKLKIISMSKAMIEVCKLVSVSVLHRFGNSTAVQSAVIESCLFVASTECWGLTCS